MHALYAGQVSGPRHVQRLARRAELKLLAYNKYINIDLGMWRCVLSTLAKSPGLAMSSDSQDGQN